METKRVFCRIQYSLIRGTEFFSDVATSRISAL